MFEDWRFCVTDGGYLGVSPTGAAVGDLLIIVYGHMT
jgi:hypothetical protein